MILDRWDIDRATAIQEHDRLSWVGGDEDIALALTVLGDETDLMISATVYIGLVDQDAGLLLQETVASLNSTLPYRLELNGNSLTLSSDL